MIEAAPLFLNAFAYAAPRLTQMVDRTGRTLNRITSLILNLRPGSFRCMLFNSRVPHRPAAAVTCAVSFQRQSDPSRNATPYNPLDADRYSHRDSSFWTVSAALRSNLNRRSVAKANQRGPTPPRTALDMRRMPPYSSAHGLLDGLKLD